MIRAHRLKLTHTVHTQGRKRIFLFLMSLEIVQSQTEHGEGENDGATDNDSGKRITDFVDRLIVDIL